MNFDLIGKIQQTKLPYSQSLLPLYEAIINSIHSTKYAGIENGYIDVDIERDNNQLTIDTDEDLSPIKNFLIKDNGIGFDELNYNSFNTANSTHKFLIGGKGVGRFIWLKAFKSVEIESIYKENGHMKLRQFDFKLQDQGIGSHSCKVVENLPRQTRIKLCSYILEYQKACPNDLNSICDKIIEHCMEYFVLENCPVIRVNDLANRKSLVLNDIYKEHIKKLKSVNFEIKGFKFDIDIYTVFNLKTKHQIHFCAHNREVYNKPLSNDIPELNRKIKNKDEDEFYVRAYVKSPFFDEIVNSERTHFNFPAKDEDIDFPNLISENELKRVITDNIEVGLGTHLTSIRDVKVDRIRDYIQRKAPQYRPLLKYKAEALKKMPLMSEDKLEIELFKVLHELETEIKTEGKKLFRQIKTVKDFANYHEKYNEYIDKVIHVGNTNLSKYIFHRKVVLDILDKQLGSDEFGKFAKEEAIHRLIFPLRATSDDINYEDHNLWIIDERLAYHNYLASDKKFTSIEPVEVNSDERPDLVAFKEYFDNRYAFSERKNNPFQSVVILEFKRPMRTDYHRTEDNPIDQVLGYVDEIRNGKAKLKDNRLFNIKDIPFYCYIICDLTPKLMTFASNYNFTIMPDGQGYFGYNNNHKAYIEIISYDKLLDDAKQRNQILFEKLKL